MLYSRKDLHSPGTKIWLVDIEGRDDQEILNFGAAVKVEASWFPDGQRVLFLAEAKNHRPWGNWEMRSGRITWPLDDPRRNIERACAHRHLTHTLVKNFMRFTRKVL